jgi:hypothetical protein
MVPGAVPGMNGIGFLALVIACVVLWLYATAEARK